MPIPLPNLDDRTFDDLTAEARALIPGLQPEWTNHNPSDPGITLVELLAWLTEMLLFQVNQIRRPTSRRSSRCSTDPTRSRPEADAAVEAASPRETVLEPAPARPGRHGRGLRGAGAAGRPAGPAGPLHPGPQPRRDRSRAAPADRAGARQRGRRPRAAEPVAPDRRDRPTTCSRALWSFLDDRRTLATRHHVVGPTYVPRRDHRQPRAPADAPPDAALTAAHEALGTFLDPLNGGVDGTGWPFGRALSAAEVYRVLDEVRFVDYVEDVRSTGPSTSSSTRRAGVAGTSTRADRLRRPRPAPGQTVER